MEATVYWSDTVKGESVVEGEPDAIAANDDAVWVV